MSGRVPTLPTTTLTSYRGHVKGCKGLRKMSLNPLSVILNKNQLVGENYVDWKRNLNIVLTPEKHKFVLDEVCLETPKDDSMESQKAAHEKWHHSNEMAHCYISASMSNVLQQKHQNTRTTFDIMESLQEMFGHQS
ncbi:uncharacterized protein LOC111375847 [Olea europaea var. sylvestris]|uniref:uncharacterized protein LOC111375847 n=1 Tax=Olea europaea var. sylvestris TaxID=158386 RepID=UPI000C1D8A28|nr:uncharacterized protein LOC111375847 [Olea europaea var. sylvestris]